MIKVRLEEARERLDDLVRQAKQGERIIITEDDRPVAELVGWHDSRARIKEAIAFLQKRPKSRLSLEQIRELIEEGRP